MLQFNKSASFYPEDLLKKSRNKSRNSEFKIAVKWSFVKIFRAVFFVAKIPVLGVENDSA